MGSWKQSELRSLIYEIQNGSESAFETLYESYMPLVYSIAIKMLKHRSDAEDVCHDVFVDFLRHPERYDPERGSLEAWLAIKTKSKCLDLLRAQKKRAAQTVHEEAPLSLPSHPHDPTVEQTLSQELREMMRRALDHIPAAQRQVLHHVYFKGETQRTIATQMKRPLGTIKSLVRYGLKNLKKQVEAWEDYHPKGESKR